METPSLQEWSGIEIRRYREQKNISLETLMENTRIRKSYLVALENEEFAKLPARVFVRGFLLQIARELKLPPDQLIDSYLHRLQQWSISQTKKSG